MGNDDVAMFWDFLSVFQKERSRLQGVLFKVALYGMQLLYSHDQVTMLHNCPILTSWNCELRLQKREQ